MKKRDLNARLNLYLERHMFLLPAARIAVFFRDKYRVTIGTFGRSIAIERYLSSHQARKLQIGAGSNILHDWLNTDLYPMARGVVCMDARRPFPLKNSSFDYIFSEHQIEHLTYNEGLSMLRECYRVLKPGGRIRIATPDLQVLIGLYTSIKSDAQKTYIKLIVDKFIPETGIYSESFVLNNIFREHGHQFIYDRATLELGLGNIGFVDITPYKPGVSGDEVFRGIEGHGKALGDEDMNCFETMVLEAKRP